MGQRVFQRFEFIYRWVVSLTSAFCFRRLLDRCYRAMEDHVSRKVSVSVRNALSVNSQKSHQLERQVKNLEAERDMRLLNLQIKRDEVFFTSPSTRRKVLVKSPSVSEGLRTSTPTSQHEMLDLKTGSRKDEEVNKLQKAHNLPPLMHLDRAGVIATPPRVRKARNIPPATSPNAAPPPLSPLESSQPSHKLLTRQSSSPQMLSNPNSIANANDLRREGNTESKHLLSPRLLRSNPESPPPLHSSTSPGVFKFNLAQNQAQLPRRPATVSSGDSGGSEVHRGLLLLPVTSSKEQTKQKEAKKINVFNRLYSGSKKGKRTHHLSDDLAPREIPFPKGNPKLDLATRRRSLSLSDLSEICDKLKTCRYLRDKSQLS